MENFVLLNAINAIFLGNARKTAKDNIFEKKITLNQEDQYKNFVQAIKLNFLKKIQQKLPQDIQPVAPQKYLLLYYLQSASCRISYSLKDF